MSRLRIPASAALLTLAATLWLAVTAATAMTPGQRHAKARYYYLEGAEAAAQDRFVDAFILMEKAHRTEPGYAEAAYGYGTFLMTLSQADTTENGRKKWEEGALLRRPLIDAYPQDQSQVTMYAQQLVTDKARTINGQPAAVEAVRVLERLDSLGTGTSGTHLLQLSNIYSMMEMPDSVLGALTRYERREGSSPELLEKKVALLFASGAVDRAITEIEGYRAEHPRDVNPLILLSMMKYTQEDPDSSMYYLQEAEKLSPEDFEVKARISMLALERGDTAVYSAKVLEALTLPEGEFEEKMDLMRHYLDLIDFKEGSDDTRRLRETFALLHGQFPQDAELYLLEGITELNLENKEKGEELIKRSIALNPESVSSRVALVQTYLRDDKKKEALEELRKLWDELGPVPSLRSLAVALAIEEKDYDVALDFLKRAAREINPQIDLEKTFALEEEIMASLTYDKYIDLGYIFQEAGDVYQKMGSLEDMERSFENALMLLPNNALILNNYAYYLALAGRSLEKADTMSQRAVTLDPGNPTYTDTRAWVLYRLGRLDEAKAEIEGTIGLYEKMKGEGTDDEAAEAVESGMVETLCHYAEILDALGHKDEAREQWERVRKVDPDNEEAAKALSR